MTNEITTTETIIENAKYTVTAMQKRQLDIRISDLLAAKDSYKDEQEWFAKVGEMMAMKSGVVPFSGGVEFKSLPPMKEKIGEKTFLVYYFADAKYLREAKLCLMRSHQLLHQPHAMSTDQAGIRKYKVDNLTRRAAMQVFEHNRNIFCDIIIVDTNREDTKVEVTEILPSVPSVEAPEVIEEVVEEVSQETSPVTILLDETPSEIDELFPEE